MRTKLLAIGAATVLIVAYLMLGPTGLVPASATQLPNDWNARNCEWIKYSPRQVIQACADIGSYGEPYPENWGAKTDITAFKEINGVVTKDDRIKVSFDSLQVFADQMNVTPATSYPTGPLAGYASGASRIPGSSIDEIAGKKVKVVATLGLWNGGAEIKVFKINSLTVTAPNSAT